MCLRGVDMYNRYGDLSKFITDADQLCTENDGYVYLSKEENYDIAVDMESCYGSLDEVRAFLIFLAKHICELDNLVQRFNQKNRMKKSGYVCLPSPKWVLRFDYLQSMEKEPEPQKKEFPFDLSIIYIEEPNIIVFDYWCTNKNTQLDVTFEYRENQFFLRKYGSFDCIPDNWEQSLSSPKKP